MEKHPDPFDDFIKEALKGHRLAPRQEARKAFLEEASMVSHARRGWKYWYFIPVIIVFLSGVIAFLVTYNASETGSLLPVGSVDQYRESVSMPEIIPAPENTPVTSALDNSASINIPGTAQVQLTHKQQPAISINAPATITQGHGSIAHDPISTNRDSIITTPYLTNNIQEPSTTTQELTNTTQDSNLTPQDPEINDLDPATNDKDPITTDQDLPTADPDPTESSVPWRFASGFYYLPEMMFNTLEGSKYIHNAGLEAVFYHGPVSVRTGVGVSVSKGITTNSVEYNDYLGAYNKLDSITFIYNEEVNNFEPNIFTSSEKVWDSTRQEDSAEIVKRYTYVQVPLVLGFDFWQKGRLSVGVRIGTIMSVMLKANQLTGEYDPGENRVVGINQLTPSQVSLNWQAIGGFTAAAALTQKMYLEIEPQAKYYYGSIYEKSGNVKKPWSIGLRAAIMLKF